jgi:hypothetical protein
MRSKMTLMASRLYCILLSHLVLYLWSADILSVVGGGDILSPVFREARRTVCPSSSSAQNARAPTSLNP